MRDLLCPDGPNQLAAITTRETTPVEGTPNEPALPASVEHDASRALKGGPTDHNPDTAGSDAREQGEKIVRLRPPQLRPNRAPGRAADPLSVAARLDADAVRANACVPITLCDALEWGRANRVAMNGDYVAALRAIQARRRAEGLPIYRFIRPRGPTEPLPTLDPDEGESRNYRKPANGSIAARRALARQELTEQAIRDRLATGVHGSRQ